MLLLVLLTFPPWIHCGALLLPCLALPDNIMMEHDCFTLCFITVSPASQLWLMTASRLWLAIASRLWLVTDSQLWLATDSRLWLGLLRYCG